MASNALNVIFFYYLCTKSCYWNPWRARNTMSNLSNQ